MSLPPEPDFPATSRLPLHGRLSDRSLVLALRMVPGYFAVMLIGALVLRFGGILEAGNELSWSRTIFTSVNSATLSGFQLSNLTRLEGERGPVTILVLMLSGMLFSLAAGGLAVARILQLPYTDRQIIWGALVTTLIAVLAGTLGTFTRERTLFESVFLATSAFGNCGLTLGGLEGVGHWETHLVLLPLALLGGLGLTVLMELLDRFTGLKPLSTHARVVLMTTAGLYILATVVFFAAQSSRHAMDADNVRADLISSSASAINARGAGFPLEMIGSYPRTMQWVLVVLMFIGANPAGTAGGLKATTLVQLVSGIRAALRGQAVQRAFGIAAAWFGVYCGVIVAGFLFLVWRVPDLAADRLLFLTVSAASNVGLSHDPISITGPGLHTLSAIMLAGRLLPLVILWWMAQSTSNAEVAVG